MTIIGWFVTLWSDILLAIEVAYIYVTKGKP